MNEVQIIALCVVTAAAVGAFVGMVLTAAAAETLLKRWMPPLPDYLLVQKLIVQPSFTHENGDLFYQSKTNVEATGVNAQFVEKWLAQRDLMMVPKGKDFVVPAKK